MMDRVGVIASARDMAQEICDLMEDMVLNIGALGVSVADLQEDIKALQERVKDIENGVVFK